MAGGYHQVDEVRRSCKWVAAEASQVSINRSGEWGDAASLLPNKTHDKARLDTRALVPLVPRGVWVIET